MGRGWRWAGLGWLLSLAGVALPWTDNRISGQVWLVELVERHVGVVALYAGALGALALSVVMIILRAARIAVVLPAAVGLLTMIITVLVTPRGDTIFDGADSTGRPFGGSEPTSWSFGPATALLGAVLVLVVGIGCARSVGRRG